MRRTETEIGETDPLFPLTERQIFLMSRGRVNSVRSYERHSFHHREKIGRIIWSRETALERIYIIEYLSMM